MPLPITPPLLPQLAKSRSTLPDGDGWAFEPKWDGFRCIAFVDGSELYLQSRSGKPLLRYFPELAFPEGRYVVDGEIVILGPRRPAGVRPARPAHPPRGVADRAAVRRDAGHVIGFDLLAFEDDVLMDLPLAKRRELLEKLPGLELTPQVRSAAEAEPWLRQG